MSAPAAAARAAGVVATPSRRRLLLHKTDDMLVQIISVDAAINCAIGLGGGLPGHPGDYRFGEGAVPPSGSAAAGCVGSGAELTESVGELPRVFAKDVTTMQPGDVFVAQYSGGGGFGDPLTRAPEHVVSDIADKALLRSAAEEHYGVVMLDEGSVDADATAAARERLRAARLSAAAPPAVPVDGRMNLDQLAGSIGGAVAYGHPEGDDAHWVCPECGQLLGAITANYKDGAARLEQPPQEVSPEQYPDPVGLLRRRVRDPAVPVPVLRARRSRRSSAWPATSPSSTRASTVPSR